MGEAGSRGAGDGAYGEVGAVGDGAAGDSRDVGEIGETPEPGCGPTTAHLAPTLDPAWLAARLPFDARAMARPLLVEVSAHFAVAGAIRVVDLGAGTGAMVRHLWRRLPAEQDWLLVDRDAALGILAFEVLGRWAGRRGWRARREGRALELRGEGRRLRVRVLAAPLDSAPVAEALAGADLATANALLDLLDESGARALARGLAAGGVPLLATLNYRRTRFVPRDAATRRIERLYDAHMRRPRPAGDASRGLVRPLGPACVPVCAGAFRAAGARVRRAASPWRVASHDVDLLGHLLRFVREAVGEMLPPREHPALARWLAARRRLAARGRLRVEVDHEDLLVTFERP